MPGRDEVPEEALKLARIAEKMVFGQSSARDGLRQVLAAAAPAIRNQERQRIQEALGSEETRDRLHELLLAEGWSTTAHRCENLLKVVAQAALLDTLDPSGEEEAERCDGSGKLPHVMSSAGSNPFGPPRDCPGCADCDPSGEGDRWVDEGLSHPPLENVQKARIYPSGEQGEGFKPKPLAVVCRELVDEWSAGELDAELGLSILRAELIGTPVTDPSKEEGETTVERLAQHLYFEDGGTVHVSDLSKPVRDDWLDDARRILAVIGIGVLGDEGQDL